MYMDATVYVLCRICVIHIGWLCANNIKHMYTICGICTTIHIAWLLYHT